MNPRSVNVYVAVDHAARYIGCVRATYELFDHTADMGIRVRAATMPELLEPAAAALYAAVGDLVAAEEPRQKSTLILEAADPATLLRDFLGELLLVLERDDRIATAVEVANFTDRSLTATVETARIDHTRSAADREVKAITYHELAIRAIPGGFEARIIVDI